MKTATYRLTATALLIFAVTLLLAAASGEVTYSDTLKYYGETIIVKHDENF